MGRLFELLTSFEGRISRAQWWLAFVIVGAANVLGGMLLNPDYFFADELPPPSRPDTIWQIVLLYPLTAITVKRFNDRDWPWWLGYLFASLGAVFCLSRHMSGWIGPVEPMQSLTLLLPLLAYFLFAFIDNAFFRGTEGPNAYGPGPLSARTQPA